MDLINYLLRCQICGKDFNALQVKESVKQQRLKAHTATCKQKIKDNPCLKCSKRFSNVYTLDTHVKSIHDNVRRFACSVCPYGGYVKRHVIRHMKAKHGFVDKIALERGDFRQCIKVKQEKIDNSLECQMFYCEYCSKPFKENVHLDEHQINRHGEHSKVSNKIKKWDCLVSLGEKVDAGYMIEKLPMTDYHKEQLLGNIATSTKKEIECKLFGELSKRIDLSNIASWSNTFSCSNCNLDSSSYSKKIDINAKSVESTVSCWKCMFRQRLKSLNGLNNLYTSQTTAASKGNEYGSDIENKDNMLSSESKYYARIGETASTKENGTEIRPNASIDTESENELNEEDLRDWMQLPLC